MVIKENWKLNKPIDEELFEKIFKNIDDFFDKITDDHDGTLLSQEILNYTDSFRTKYGNMRVMRNKK